MIAVRRLGITKRERPDSQTDRQKGQTVRQTDRQTDSAITYAQRNIKKGKMQKIMRMCRLLKSVLFA